MDQVSVQQLMLESLGVFRAHVPPVTYVARMGHVNYCNRSVQMFDRFDNHSTSITKLKSRYFFDMANDKDMIIRYVKINGYPDILVGI